MSDNQSELRGRVTHIVGECHCKIDDNCFWWNTAGDGTDATDALMALIEARENKLLTEMKKLLDIQGYQGNWNYDPYMHGMYNGMELMVAVAENREPDYKKAPTKWVADFKIEDTLTHPSSKEETTNE